MFTPITHLIAAAAALTAATAATAASPAAESRTVRYDDLNLASSAGVARLERRIDSAARGVCGQRDDSRQSLAMRAAAEKCVAQAKSRAMNQVARLETGNARGG